MGFGRRNFGLLNLLNLKALNYVMWSAVEKKACTIYHPNANALAASVEKEWKAVSAATLDMVSS